MTALPEIVQGSLAVEGLYQIVLGLSDTYQKLIQGELRQHM